MGAPPVRPAHQGRRGRHEEHPRERGVDDDREDKAQADLLDGGESPGHETGEHDRHEQRRRGDDAARPLQPTLDGGVVVAGLPVDLGDSPEQEDVVVHRQAEGDREDEYGGGDAETAERLGAYESAEVALLEDPYQRTEAGAQAEQVHDDRLRRHHDQAGEEEQQHERAPQDDRERQRQPLAQSVLVVRQRHGVARHLDPHRRLEVAHVPDCLHRLPAPALTLRDHVDNGEARDALAHSHVASSAMAGSTAGCSRLFQPLASSPVVGVWQLRARAPSPLRAKLPGPLPVIFRCMHEAADAGRLRMET